LGGGGASHSRFWVQGAMVFWGFCLDLVDERDGGGKEAGCDTSGGEPGGKTRIEDNRKETSLNSRKIRILYFVDVLLSAHRRYRI